MKDFLGNDLEIGDEVVLTAPNYRHFVKATVFGFTPKQVRVTFMNTWNYGTTGRKTDFLTYGECLVKVK